MRVRASRSGARPLALGFARPWVAGLSLAALGACKSSPPLAAASSSSSSASPSTSASGSAAHGGAPAGGAARLEHGLAVHLGVTGHVVRVPDGRLAPGCASTSASAGVTVPLRSDARPGSALSEALDLAALTRCARAAHRRGPPGETRVRFTADDGVDYQSVLSTLDALRADAEGELYPEPSLGMSDAQVPPSDEARVSLPTPERARPEPEGREPLAVIVTKTQLLVGDDPQPTLRLPARDEQARVGVGAAHKGGRADAFFVVPLGERFVTLARAGELPRAVVLVADAGAPWRVLLEVHHTLTKLGVPRVELLAIQRGR